MLKATKKHVQHTGDHRFEMTLQLPFWTRVKILFGWDLLITFEPGVGYSIGRVVWRLPETPGLTQHDMPVNL